MIWTFGAAVSRKTTTRSSPVRETVSTARAVWTFGPSASVMPPRLKVPPPVAGETGALIPFTVTRADESETVPETVTDVWLVFAPGVSGIRS